MKEFGLHDDVLESGNYNKWIGWNQQKNINFTEMSGLLSIEHSLESQQASLF
jgi:hypothetical protein